MKYLGGIILISIFALQTNALMPAPFFLRILKNKALDIIDKAKIGKDECSTNLKSLVIDLGNLTRSWALKMIDASAKPQTGILTGNIHQIGNYDQCLKIREDRGKFGIVEGQYCTVTLTPSKNYTNEYSHLLIMINFIEWATGINLEEQHVVDIMKYQKSTFGLCLPKSCNSEHLQVISDHIEKTFKMPLHIQLSDAMCSYKGKQTFPFAIDKYIL